MAKKNANKEKKTIVNKPDNGNGKIKQNNVNTLFTKDELLKALRLMYLSRLIDNKAMNLLRQGKSFFHIACAGHEAIQVATASQLNPEVDWFFPYYRDLAFSLTCGITPYEFLLQSLAKADDPACGGRQLPCHWGAKKINMPAQSSPTGTQFLQAVGTALASVKKGIKNISYVSSGEGTTSQGEFHEAINWASREKLPVLFVIQNNKYAISVPVEQQTGGKDGSVSEMMSGYENLLRLKIDGTDYIESFIKVKEAIDHINNGNGPVLIEAEVVRLLSHSSSDDQKKYRKAEELDEDQKKCPIDKFSKLLIKEGHLTVAQFEKMKFQLKEEVDNAADEAAKAEDPKQDTATLHIFDESGFKDTLEYEKSHPSGNKLVMVDAINHALREELEINDKIYMFGEDIADPKGGVFTATKGLSTQFGNDRVFNSPLAEASIIGVATGMALAGLKPVVEIQFGDYIWPAFMQFKDELATIRYRSNNAWAAPVVTRVAVGGYIHGGLYHSQNIESIFAHIPGIYIIYPSNAADAKGLLKTAIRINDPVIFCEHKGLYRQSYSTTLSPDKDYLLPLGKAKIVQHGEDLTVISYGLSLWDSLNVSKRLSEEEGYSIEVIDLRTIIPLDEETIYNSVKKTGKVMIVHEDTFTAGFGAEIAARVADNCFKYLDGPVKRITADDVHIPYHPLLESAVLPTKDKIYKGMKELLSF